MPARDFSALSFFNLFASSVKKLLYFSAYYYVAGIFYLDILIGYYDSSSAASGKGMATLVSLAYLNFRFVELSAFLD